MNKITQFILNRNVNNDEYVISTFIKNITSLEELIMIYVYSVKKRKDNPNMLKCFSVSSLIASLKYDFVLPFVLENEYFSLEDGIEFMFDEENKDMLESVISRVDFLNEGDICGFFGTILEVTRREIIRNILLDKNSLSDELINMMIKNNDDKVLMQLMYISFDSEFILEYDKRKDNNFHKEFDYKKIISYLCNDYKISPLRACTILKYYITSLERCDIDMLDSEDIENLLDRVFPISSYITTIENSDKILESRMNTLNDFYKRLKESNMEESRKRRLISIIKNYVGNTYAFQSFNEYFKDDIIRLRLK